MNRSEFWKWLDTCPEKEWFQADDDGGVISIDFPVDWDEDEDEEEENEEGEE